MPSEMSAKYLLTFISDRCNDLKGLLKMLEEKDNMWVKENKDIVDSVNIVLANLKSSVEKRRDSIIVSAGGDPKDYSF